MVGLNHPGFREAFKAFTEIPFPGRPRGRELGDWAFRLLELDSHIGSGAMAVHNGSLRAREMPEMESLVLRVESLRQDLEGIDPEMEYDTDLLDAYRTYVAALERLVREFASLSRENPDH